MKAMILAAGLGSRLKEVTKNRPKCMVEVGNHPMLYYVIEKLLLAGVNGIIINLHYKGEQIEEYIRANNSFGIDIRFSHETHLLGTGGGIKYAQWFLEDSDPFIVVNSDIYSTLNLRDLVTHHTNSNALVTLAVMDRLNTRPLLFDSTDNLCGWENTEKGTGETFGSDISTQAYAFSGIQVLSPGLFKYMESDSGEFSSIRIYLRAAQHGEKVQAYRMDDQYWMDMGTPEKLEELRLLMTTKTDHN